MSDVAAPASAAPETSAPESAPEERVGAFGAKPKAQAPKAPPAKPGITDTSVRAPGDKFPQETNDDGDEEGKEPPKPEKKKYKVKIEDEETEVDEDELLKGYQRARAANKKFEEVAQARKEVETQAQQIKELVGLLRENPLKILGKLLPAEKLREVFENHLYGVYQDEQLAPEVRQAKSVYEEYQQMKAEKAEAEQRQKDEAKQKEASELKAKAFDQFAGKFAKALEGADIPKTAFTVKRMAEYQRHALQNGYDLTPQELGALVKEDLEKEMAPVVQHMRQRDVERVQMKPQAVAQPSPKPRAAQETRRIVAGTEEWREHIKRKAGF